MAVAEAGISLTDPSGYPISVLNSLGVEESGRHNIVAGAVSVRTYPFPYRAAFAMSNDPDSMSLDAFFDWHGFVNGTGPTSYGDGLGLEIGDAFWIYAAQSYVPSLFKGNPFDEVHVEGPAVSMITELGRLGWLDTLHSFGNWLERFARPGREFVMRRDQIERGLEYLDRINVRPYVYTNHSGSPSNVGGPWAFYQKADDPQHPLYCLDILKQFGFKYHWIDACVQFEKFGDELDYSDTETLAEAVSRFRWDPWIRRRLVSDRTTLVPIGLPADEVAQKQLFTNFFNRIILPLKAQDGSDILVFKRQRGLDQPSESTFCMQVSSADLDTLEERRGSVIVYQHFGVQAARGRLPALAKRKKTVPPVLDAHSVACWRDIARRFYDGRLFVTTTGRLLNWLWVRDALRFSVAKNEERWVIHLEKLECPTGRHPNINAADLNGIAFLVPSDAPEIVLSVAGSAAPLSTTRSRDPVHHGFDAVYTPWNRLEWPL